MVVQQRLMGLPVGRGRWTS